MPRDALSRITGRVVTCAQIAAWHAAGLKLSDEQRGFWLLYDLLCGHYRVRVLPDASPHNLGAILMRLSNHSGWSAAWTPPQLTLP